MTEISELRRRLHEQEQENRNLREQYQITRKQLKDTQDQLSKYEQYRDELITLRNHVYQESQDIPEIPKADLESMQKAIAEHSILIVGGHINWHNRLRQLFPKWKFIDIHHYNTVDVRVVDGVEKVYFFTDYLSHLTYRKMINAIRNKKVEFGYVGNVNVERFVQQVYQDLEGGFTITKVEDKKGNDISTFISSNNISIFNCGFNIYYCLSFSLFGRVC